MKTVLSTLFALPLVGVLMSGAALAQSAPGHDGHRTAPAHVVAAKKSQACHKVRVREQIPGTHRYRVITRCVAGR